MKTAGSGTQLHRFPGWFRAAGFVGAIGALYLACRLVYEQTFLTWAFGPQMVGFSLAHSGLFIPLFLSAALFALWVFVAVCWTGWSWWRGTQIPPVRWVALALSITALLTLAIPYATWQRLFVNKLAAGKYAGEHLSYAAATGDLATVKALLSRGVAVDARNSDGTTALFGAAVGGKVDVIEFLMSQGADLSIHNSVGESMVEAARSMNHEAAAELLLAHGAPAK